MSAATLGLALLAAAAFGGDVVSPPSTMRLSVGGGAVSVDWFQQRDSGLQTKASLLGVSYLSANLVHRRIAAEVGGLLLHDGGATYLGAGYQFRPGQWTLTPYAGGALTEVVSVGGVAGTAGVGLAAHYISKPTTAWTWSFRSRLFLGNYPGQGINSRLWVASLMMSRVAQLEVASDSWRFAVAAMDHGSLLRLRIARALTDRLELTASVGGQPIVQARLGQLSGTLGLAYRLGSP